MGGEYFLLIASVISAKGNSVGSLRREEYIESKRKHEKAWIRKHSGIVQQYESQR